MAFKLINIESPFWVSLAGFDSKSHSRFKNGVDKNLNKISAASVVDDETVVVALDDPGVGLAPHSRLLELHYVGNQLEQTLVEEGEEGGDVGWELNVDKSVNSKGLHHPQEQDTDDWVGDQEKDVEGK